MTANQDYQVLIAREEERRRLARDLHDGLLQSLVNILLTVDGCARRWPEGADGEELQRVRAAAEAALEEGRLLLSELRPVLPGEVGLPAAIQAYLDRFAARTGLRTRFSVSGTVRPLSPPEELAIFRICQEALSNVGKHAGGTRVEISLAYRPQRVRLQVGDDGRGMAGPPDVGRLLEGRKYGVVGMLERAAALGGELAIQARPGGGTLVDLVLPAGRGRV